MICFGDCAQGRRPCGAACKKLNRFADSVRDQLVTDAPEWVPSKLPGDGDRELVGLAIVLLCAGVVIALIGWGVVIYFGAVAPTAGGIQ